MKARAVASVALVLMVSGGAASARMMLHEPVSERPEIRALQERMIALGERRSKLVEWYMVGVDAEEEDRAQVRRDAARARLGLAAEAWALAVDASRLWRPAVLLADEAELALDEEAVQVYTDAVAFAISVESGAVSLATESHMVFRLEWGVGPWPGVTFRERLDKLTRKLAEIQSERGAGNVRPEPGVLHRPPREEARWLAEGAHDLARAVREQAVNQSPMESFELYVQCVSLSLLADAYFLELRAPRR